MNTRSWLVVICFGCLLTKPIKINAQNVGIGTTTPTSLFSVAERFKVDSATGSLSFTHPAGAISFAAPTPSAN
jgi:hypothetical protein